MKKLFCILTCVFILTALCMFSANAETYTGKCGSNLTYVYDDTACSLTISGTGNMYNYSSTSAPWGCMISDLVIEEGVTSIGNYAFYGIECISHVSLPESVTSIGTGAFQLSYIDSISGHGVTNIESYAFSNGIYLESVYFPNVEYIGQDAFKGSNELYYYNDGACYISLGGSEYLLSVNDTVSFTLSKDVRFMHSNAFSNCNELTNIYYTGDVADWLKTSRFGQSNPMLYADNFYFNGELVTDVVIPDGVTSIPDYAFYGCETLTSVTIPDSVTSIGEGAFSGCSGLTSITIGKGLESTGTYCFSGCYNLENVYYTGDVEGWLKIKFGVPYANDATPLFFANKLYLDGKLVTEVVIPDGVTSITKRAFYNCSTLRSIVIPESVTTIEHNAFYNCTALRSIAIPNNLTSIGNSAFDGCKNLASFAVNDGNLNYSSLDGVLFNKEKTMLVRYPEGKSGAYIIPNGVTAINDYAFNNCSGLTNITIPTDVTSIGSSAFSGCSENLVFSCVCGSYGETFAKNAKYSVEKIHIFEVSVDVAPTCTDAGAGNRICSVCAFSQRVELPMLGHDMVPCEYKAPSCTEVGNNAYDKCSRCDYTTYSEIPATGHSYALDTVYEAATCTAAGYGKEVCANCGSSQYVDIPATGHSYELSVTYEEPTCTAVGAGKYVCPDCGSSYFSELPALGHDLVQYEAKAATCTEIGYDAYEACSRCDYNTCVELPVLGHDLTPYDAKAATCTEIGYEAYEICSRCDYTTYAEIPALGHDLTQCEAKAATCTEIGYEAYEKCSRCEYTTYAEIPALGHDLTQYEAKAATCTEYGYDAYETCSRCDYSSYKKISALGHALTYYGGQKPTYESSGWKAYEVCSRCDYNTYAELPMLDDKITYNLDTLTGVLTISGNGRMDSYSEAAEVPWYENRNEILSIVVEDGITYIGQRAFYECANVKSVSLPDTLESIDMYAFIRCSSLTSIVIPDSVTTMGTSVFRGCDSLKEITLPSVNIFGALFGTVYYADSVKCLYYYVSGSSTKSTAYYVPASLEKVTVKGGEIAFGAFYNCTMLKEVVICDGVSAIAASAFRGCTGITEIVIPSSVTSIGKTAFRACTELVSVTIPPSVTSIASQAFYNCPKLTIYCHSGSVASTYSLNNSHKYSNIHFWVDDETGIEPTCTESGISAGSKCAYCEETQAGGAIVAALGHDIVKYDGKAPTPDSVGWEAYEACTRCDYTTYKELKYSEEDLKFVFNSENGVLTIYDQIAINDFELVTETPWYAYRDSITAVVIESGVTHIGARAFYDCKNLTSVIIPETVVSIGESAFANCSAITKIAVPATVETIGDSAFAGCSGITEITLPYVEVFGALFGSISFENSTSAKYYPLSGGGSTYITYYVPTNLEKVTILGGEIGFGAFYHCIMLKDIVICDGVTAIGASAFRGCTGITSISIPDSVTSLGNAAFRGATELVDVTIGSGLLSIGNEAFYNCQNLENIIISDNVTSIGNKAFFNCTAIENIVIPNSVINIGDSAFLWCARLENVTLSSHVTTIGYDVFSHCTSLTNIIIPDSVTYIDYSAFSSCNALTSINVSENNSIYSSIDGVLYNKAQTEILLCPRGKEGVCVVPDSATGVFLGAFNSCDKITSLELGSGFGEYLIDYENAIVSESDFDSLFCYVFNSCANLTNISVSENNMYYSSIDGAIFDKAQTKLLCCPPGKVGDYSIPSGVTCVGYFAFYNCYRLTSITIPESVASFYYDEFWGDVPVLRCVCGSYGETYAKECGYVYEITHAFEETVVSEPTTNSAGQKKLVCTACGHTEYKEIPTLAPVQGDFDGDGEVSIEDAMISLKAFLDDTVFDGVDINGDGNFNLLDVIRLLKEIVK